MIRRSAKEHSGSKIKKSVAGACIAGLVGLLLTMLPFNLIQAQAAYRIGYEVGSGSTLGTLAEGASSMNHRMVCINSSTDDDYNMKLSSVKSSDLIAGYLLFKYVDLPGLVQPCLIKSPSME